MLEIETGKDTSYESLNISQDLWHELNGLVRIPGLWNHKKTRFSEHLRLRAKGRFFETIAGPNRSVVWTEIFIILNQILNHEH